MVYVSILGATFRSAVIHDMVYRQGRLIGPVAENALAAHSVQNLKAHHAVFAQLRISPAAIVVSGHALFVLFLAMGLVPLPIIF
jgi:hypothetical protein